MSWKERVELYKQIETHRGRPLIVYVTSKRDGVNALMSTDSLPYIIQQIDELPEDSKAVDFLIASHGGDPMVAWRIMTLIRQRVEKVAVMIPQSAYSAATLVAFGADEIIMHPNGHLGPVDMQITTFGEGGQKRFSTEDISAFLDFVRDNLKITDQEHVRVLFELTCKEVGTLGIGFTARSSKLAVALGERLLALHMKEEEVRSKVQSIVQNMSRKFHSHAYPVSRTEAADIGLPVNKERDKDLEKLMWSVWLNLAQELEEHIPFDPLMELLRSPEGVKLLAPVKQLDIPFGAVQSVHWNTNLDDVIKHATQTIDPVDFEYVNAVVESSRGAYNNVHRGKILSCRNIDLMINYNRIITSREWEPVV
ncbi:MAG TPA: hypothetical protein VGQ12_06875 [Candidatus Angelobacter sp.]|jgi:hypothetical protein|nr:hypothetical protein [Candidatus Angelobacter sp.]